MAGTEVLTGSTDQPGIFSETKIEVIEVGDWVWARDEDDADDDLELRQVTQVFRHTAFDLQEIQLQGADGNVEILNVTDEHPFWVDGPPRPRPVKCPCAARSAPGRIIPPIPRLQTLPPGPSIRRPARLA